MPLIGNIPMQIWYITCDNMLMVLKYYLPSLESQTKLALADRDHEEYVW